MPVKFTGKHPEIEWVETDFYSLDIAIRKNYTRIGWPTRTLTQVSGPTSTGKSTFINSVACVIGRKLDLNIACLDLETQDPATIKAVCNNMRFENEWKWTEPDKRKKEDSISDEYLLGLLRKDARDGYITILDSVASISPVAEVAGNIGDANMGRRAFPMAQFSRLMNMELKWSEKGAVSFLANHRYEDFEVAKKGALQFAKKTHAPGGVVKENMAFIDIISKIPYIKYGNTGYTAHFGDGWVFEGKVTKNRFGLSHSDFWVYIVGGQGIHKGLTAMFDCVKLGLAEIKTGNKLYMKSTGEELGRVSDIIKKRDDYDFDMFYNLTKAHQLSAEDDAQLKLEESDEVEYVQTDVEEDDE